MKIKTMLLALFALLLIAAVPVSGVAVVDGDPGEWDLVNDYFAPMYEAGKVDKTVLSHLYLKYDCESQTLFALVLVEDGYVIQFKPDDAFLKLNGVKYFDGTYEDGNDQVPAFAWVSDRGWEGSAIVEPRDYSLNVHTQIYDDRTSAVEDRGVPLTLDCTPTAVTLSGFGANSNNVTVTIIGLIALLFAVSACIVGVLVTRGVQNDKKN